MCGKGIEIEPVNISLQGREIHSFELIFSSHDWLLGCRARPGVSLKAPRGVPLSGAEPLRNQLSVETNSVAMVPAELNAMPNSNDWSVS